MESHIQTNYDALRTLYACYIIANFIEWIDQASISHTALVHGINGAVAIILVLSFLRHRAEPGIAAMGAMLAFMGIYHIILASIWHLPA